MGGSSISRSSSFVVKVYDTRVDEKKRITLRGAEAHSQYRVKHLKDGRVLLSPIITLEEAGIPENTLKMIKKALIDLENGIVSEPIDLDEFTMEELEDDEKN